MKKHQGDGNGGPTKPQGEGTAEREILGGGEGVIYIMYNLSSMLSKTGNKSSQKKGLRKGGSAERTELHAKWTDIIEDKVLNASHK